MRCRTLRGGPDRVTHEIPCNFPDGQRFVSPPMSLLASFMNLAGPDLIVILLIILVLFGAKKLPELARGMGAPPSKRFRRPKDNSATSLTPRPRRIRSTPSRTSVSRPPPFLGSRTCRLLQRPPRSGPMTRRACPAIEPTKSSPAAIDFARRCDTVATRAWPHHLGVIATFTHVRLRPSYPDQRDAGEENLMLQTTADQIGDDLPLFGPGWLGTRFH